ncbi:MAG TPA: hypothetical protein DDY78_11840 [Planctomycetales bacterium]|nr:hypothetical protein [Planctomycetales bacterium]
MTERKKLSDILHNSERESLAETWKRTEAAADFAPLPAGEYLFRILSGELFTSKQRSTPGYKLTLEVTEGEYESRRAWVDLWLTPAALPMTKRDLAKLGITSLEQLEKPLPAGILIRGKLAIRRNDDGSESNRLTRFECAGIEPGDAFEPTDTPEADASFDPSQLEKEPAPPPPSRRMHGKQAVEANGSHLGDRR